MGNGEVILYLLDRDRRKRKSMFIYSFGAFDRVHRKGEDHVHLFIWLDRVYFVGFSQKKTVCLHLLSWNSNFFFTLKKLCKCSKNLTNFLILAQKVCVRLCSMTSALYISFHIPVVLRIRNLFYFLILQILRCWISSLIRLRS